MAHKGFAARESTTVSRETVRRPPLTPTRAASPGELENVVTELGIPRAPRVPVFGLDVLGDGGQGLARAEALLLISSPPFPFDVEIDDAGPVEHVPFSNKKLAQVFASIHTLGGKAATVSP